MEVPFALSIHKFVNSVGADAGFAAFVCVAVIGLLYFAQARETSSLRDRLEDAHERIGGLEARIAQLMHLQTTRQPVRQQPQPQAPAPGRVTPPPAGARPVGGSIASVRRVPAATAVAVAREPGPAFPVAPAGMGAPALASATKLIPDPVQVPFSAPAVPPDDTAFIPGAAVTPAANGRSERSDPSTATLPLPASAVPPVAPATASAAASPTASAAAAASPATPAAGPPAAAAAGAAIPRAAGPTPPRVQIQPDAAGSAPVAPSSRRPPASSARPLGEARFDVFEDRAGSPSGGRRLPLVIALVAVVVIVGGLVAILQSGGTTRSTVHSPIANSTSTSKSKSGSTRTGRKHRGPAFSASSVTVAVLNGTAVQGLAADVARVLSGAGYKKGSVTNAPSQSQPTTIVYFLPGHRSDADHVAAQLRLRSSSVHAATQAAIQACATTPAAATTSCSGNVIVSVGQDKASLGSSASTSAG